MYRNAYQRGMLTIFFSVGSKPLTIWDVHTKDGYITRFLDQDIKSMVYEIGGTNVSTTYITCPKGNLVLGITMPFLVMIVKNLKKYFTFEVTILDETLTRRRFRVSNFQSTTQILPLCTVMPISLSDGWNQIQFNLAEFTRRAYKKQFLEVQKVKINANIRLRRIYFTEKLIPEDQLPPEYKLYFPLSSKNAAKEKTGKENVKPSTSQQTSGGAKTGDVVSKTSLSIIKKAPSLISGVATKDHPEEEVIAAETTALKVSEKSEIIDKQPSDIETIKSPAIENVDEQPPDTGVVEEQQPEENPETIVDGTLIEASEETGAVEAPEEAEN